MRKDFENRIEKYADQGIFHNFMGGGLGAEPPELYGISWFYGPILSDFSYGLVLFSVILSNVQNYRTFAIFCNY